MKNADKPAMPVETGKLYEIATSDADGYSAAAAGLTKREHFAGLAMQATRTANPSMDSCECAALAVNDADALLSALEGTTE